VGGRYDNRQHRGHAFTKERVKEGVGHAGLRGWLLATLFSATLFALQVTLSLLLQSLGFTFRLLGFSLSTLALPINRLTLRYYA